MKILYNIILILIGTCIFLFQDMLVKVSFKKPILSSPFKNEIARMFYFLFIFTTSLIITGFIQKKIPKNYLIFVFLISLAFLIVVIYVNLKLISPQ